MCPTDVVLGRLLGWEITMDELEDGLVAIGLEADLDRGRSRWQDLAAGCAPGEDEAMGWLDHDEATADRHARDVDDEATARRRVELGPVAHPPDHQRGVGQVREDVLGLGADADRRRVVVAHRCRDRDSCRLSTESFRRASDDGQTSSRNDRTDSMASGRTEYSRLVPSRRSARMPAPLRVLRCCETACGVMSKCAAISPAGSSPSRTRG